MGFMNHLYFALCAGLFSAFIHYFLFSLLTFYFRRFLNNELIYFRTLKTPLKSYTFTFKDYLNYVL